MRYHSALFSLFGFMITYFNQTFNHKFEGINIIIKQDEFHT